MSTGVQLATRIEASKGSAHRDRIVEPRGTVFEFQGSGGRDAKGSEVDEPGTRHEVGGERGSSRAAQCIYDLVQNSQRLHV
ncbi:hypothetical protein E4U37_003430 [Claviceps purpurea]|nr:hypothetical protein E4U37_003430 [Claviceps purpurea]